jgi:hypothetical protein
MLTYNFCFYLYSLSVVMFKSLIIILASSKNSFKMCVKSLIYIITKKWFGENNI